MASPGTILVCMVSVFEADEPSVVTRWQIQGTDPHFTVRPPVAFVCFVLCTTHAHSFC